MFRRAAFFSSMTVLVSSYLVNVNLKKPIGATSFKLASANQKDAVEPMTFNGFIKNNSIEKLSLLSKLVSSALLFDMTKNVAFADNIPDLGPSSDSEAPVYVTSSTGLKYIDTKVGDGASPVPGDTVYNNFICI